MILVIGTPDSGKSALAENIAVEKSQGKRMAYIATMIPYGDEGKNRIGRHKKLREGKNFITFEEPYSVSNILHETKNMNIETALLECVSNLVGNVSHTVENLEKDKKSLIEALFLDIKNASDEIKNLVVVANNFEINSEYDEDTVRYIEINNSVNERLKTIAEMYVVKEGNEWIYYDNN